MAESNLVFHDVGQGAFRLGGYPYRAENGNYNRVPERVMPGLPMQLAWVAPQPSGGTIRFCTDSRRIAVEVELLRNETSRFCTQALLSGFDLYQGEGPDAHYLFNLGVENNPLAFTAELPWQQDGSMQSYTLYTPLQNPIKSIRVGLEDGATVEPPKGFAADKPVLFYGSSVTCGFSASRPGLTYPARVCRALNLDFINYGFGGGAKGEPAIAEAIAALDLACFVMDYDFNADSADHLWKTHEAFFRTIRARHSDLPIVIVSAPYQEKNPSEFTARREAIHATYDNARAAGDSRVWFVDGGEFLIGVPWQEYTVDAIHPNDMGFARMAAAIEPALRTALGL